MSIPVARMILMKMRDTVKGIQVANGYQTDAGLTVFLGEAPVLSENDATVAIAIEAGDEQPADASFGSRLSPSRMELPVTFPVEVHAYARVDLAEPVIAREAVIGDIKRCVENEEDWPDELKALERGDVSRFERADGTVAIGGMVEYLFTYVETWGAP
jgi:hypothetical protein